MSGHIEYFKLTNYQSWQGPVRFDLSPGVNVFVGESDHGKSAAAIRSLLWVNNNRPLSDSKYRSWSTEKKTKKGNITYDGETRVDIKLSDCPDIISRYKQNSNVNCYSIGSQVLNAPGKAVPEQITKLLNLQDVNIHRQGQGDFFISLSDPDKARYLNNLVNLDIIARTQSNINGQITSETTAIKHANATIEEKTEDLTNYTWLDNAESQLQSLETINAKLTKNRDDIRYLVTTLDSIDGIQQEIAAQGAITGAKEEIDRLYALSETVALNRLSLDELQDLINQIKETQDDINAWDKMLSAKSDIDTLIELKERYDNSADQEESLIAILDSIDAVDKEIEAAELELAEAHEDLDLNYPNECPLCGAETKGD